MKLHVLISYSTYKSITSTIAEGSNSLKQGFQSVCLFFCLFVSVISFPWSDFNRIAFEPTSLITMRSRSSTISQSCPNKSLLFFLRISLSCNCPSSARLMQIHPSPYLLSNLVFQPIIAYLVLAQAVFRVEYGSLILLINQWEANPSPCLYMHHNRIADLKKLYCNSSSCTNGLIFMFCGQCAQRVLNADACKEALFNRLFCDDMHAAQKRRIIKA